MIVIAYRGEHGSPRPNQSFHSRLPALSFGTQQAARHYALSPNRLGDSVEQPRLHKARLKISNPLHLDPEDPFLEFSEVRNVLGDEKALEMLFDLEDHLKNTDNFWNMLDESGTDSLPELHRVAGNQILNELYVDAYPVFDQMKYVRWFKEAGFDGVIHGGNGQSALETEYKVFDADQADIIETIDLTPTRAHKKSFSPGPSPSM